MRLACSSWNTNVQDQWSTARSGAAIDLTEFLFHELFEQRSASPCRTPHGQGMAFEREFGVSTSAIRLNEDN